MENIAVEDAVLLRAQHEERYAFELVASRRNGLGYLLGGLVLLGASGAAGR